MTSVESGAEERVGLAERLTDHFRRTEERSPRAELQARLAGWAATLSHAVAAAQDGQDYGPLRAAGRELAILSRGRRHLLAGWHAIVVGWIFTRAPEQAENLVTQLGTELFDPSEVSADFSPKVQGTGAVGPDDHPVALVAEKGEPLRRVRLSDPELEEGVRLPLRVRGQSLGELYVEPDSEWDQDSDEQAVLDAVTAQISQALEMARLFQESERRSAQLAAAAEISRAASSLLSLDDLMRTAVDQIQNTFRFDLVRVYLVPEGGTSVELHSAAPRNAAGSEEMSLPVKSRSVVVQAIQSAQPVVEHRALTSDQESGQPPQAKLAVPLRIGDRVIGALNVRSRATARFKKDDIAVLQTLADQIAIAIENARAYEQQRQTAEQLRELDQLKSQFLANMSHELRTPLNSIIGFSRVIMKGIDGPLTEMQAKDLSTIYNSGQLLLQLIDSILDISKIEAGKMDLDFTAVDIGQVVEVAISTATGLVAGQDVRLVKEVPENLPLIHGDPMRIRQVLLNLLSNAAKFTESGEIKVSVVVHGRYLLIKVSDTGMGIPEAKQTKLFDAFYQVDGSATRKVGGTGLGLAISRSFVELHNGQIWVESEGIPGRGTTFTFTLPIEPHREQNERSLLYSVDSEAAMTKLYEMYLTPDGYRYLSCNLPSVAPAEAAKLKPDLILLGLAAGKEGEDLALLTALKKDPRTRAIPVLVCSRIVESGIAQRAVDAGAALFLEKPVVRENLRLAVRQALATPGVQPALEA